MQKHWAKCAILYDCDWNSLFILSLWFSSGKTCYDSSFLHDSKFDNELMKICVEPDLKKQFWRKSYDVYLKTVDPSEKKNI